MYDTKAKSIMHDSYQCLSNFFLGHHCHKVSTYAKHWVLKILITMFTVRLLAFGMLYLLAV